MQTIGRFIFKSATDKDGGSFTNQSGQVINYGSSVQVKFDEVNPETKEATERKIKVAGTETALIARLKALKSYSQCDFTFEVGFNNSGCYLKLVDIAPVKNN